ncbi:MATE family efflux transporter [Thiotrichales bacterium 19S11-10]|nr:MATE family efflux transporter [Thiotrichales bacterium 19S11-10]
MQTPSSQIIKKSLQVSLSVGMMRFVQMISAFIGMLMVAHLGHNELAASAFITPIQALVFVIGASLISSVGILTAKTFGAKQHKSAGQYLINGIAIALGLSIIIDIALLNIDHLLLLLNQPKESVLLAQQYFNIFTLATPLFLLIFVFQQFMIAVDRKRLIVMMSFIGVIITAFLSFCLIFGKLGMPKLGIQGLAYSTTIWGVISVITYLTYLFNHSYFKPFGIFTHKIKIQIDTIKQLLKIGFPIALQSANDIFAFLILTIMIGWLGSDALAIQQVINQYFLLLVVPILALSQTSSILVAQSFGAKSLFNIKRYSNTILLIGLFFAMIVMGVFILFPHDLILFYAGNDHSFTEPLLNLATIILVLTGSRLLLDTIIEVKIGSLRGILDVNFPMLLSIIMSWVVGMPLAYIFCFTLGWGFVGLTVAGIVMMFISAAILYLRWVNKTKNLKFN